MQALVPVTGLTRADLDVVALWLSLKQSEHTRRAYRADITAALAALGKPLAAVTLADLKRWADGLGGSAATRCRAITAVKSLLTFCHETGIHVVNVGLALPLPRTRDRLNERILTEEQVASLLGELAPGRDRTLGLILYRSGVRISEATGLRCGDCQRRGDAGQITVFGKGGKTRSILLDPDTWAELAKLATGSGSLPVFTSRKHLGPLTPGQCARIVEAAAARAGLGTVTPHWFRHAHASHALDRGAPIHLVQATLGHASVATTGRYTHVRPGQSSATYLVGGVK